MSMSDTEYHDTQGRLIDTAFNLAALDLDGFLGRIRESHAVGPVLDPTLYRAASDGLEAVADLARAAQGVKRSVIEHPGLLGLHHNHVLEQAEGEAGGSGEYAAAAKRLITRALKAGDGAALLDVKALMDTASAATDAPGT